MQSTPVESERRRFHRIIHDTSAILSCGDSSVPVRVVDLSLQGCLLKPASGWAGQDDKIYALAIQLDESLTIQMSLRLARSADGYYGFSCSHMDIDSICELRRLVELNLGDSSLLERDLTALVDR